jgi:hypothetical protein
MKKDLKTILDESLSRLKQKESIEACLRRYPQHAAQLEPLLRTALKVEGLKDTEPPSAKAMAAGRERFLQEAARLRTERAPAPRLAKGPVKRRRFMFSMAAALLIALLLALAALAGFEAPDPLRRIYHWWGTLVPQPTMTRPATDTPWPTMTPHEDQTPTATRTLYPAESDTPTWPTFTPESSHTPAEKAAPISKPTNTPLPTATPVPPTQTPVPTITPVPPTDTPAPTATPVPPAQTPHPTEDHGGGQGDRDQGNDDDRGGNHDSGDQSGQGHDDDNPGGGDHGDSGQDSGDHDGSDGGGGRDGGNRDDHFTFDTGRM